MLKGNKKKLLLIGHSWDSNPGLVFERGKALRYGHTAIVSLATFQLRSVAMSCQCNVSVKSVYCQCHVSEVHRTLHWQSKGICGVYVFKMLLWYFCDAMTLSWHCQYNFIVKRLWKCKVTLSWQCNFSLSQSLYKGSVGYWTLSHNTVYKVIEETTPISP